MTGAACAAVLIVRDLFEPAVDYRLGRDFTNVWTAGKLALSHRAIWPFDLEAFRLGLIEYLSMPSVQIYSYPPHSLLLAVPFALVPYYVALAIWTFGGIAFFAWCAKPYCPAGFPLILAALTPAGWLNIWCGQYGFVVGGLWLLFFHLMESRPAKAGMVAALMTIKPHMGLMIAAKALTKRGAWIAACLATLFLILASVIAFGSTPWSDFLARTTKVQGDLLTLKSDEFYFRLMPSAFVTFGRHSLGVFAQVLAIIGAALLLLKHRKWDAFSAATVTFLALPYAFNYDMTVACLGFILVLFRRWDSLTLIQRVGLILAFMAPNIVFVGPISWIVPVALLYALHLQLSFLGAEAGRHPSEATPGTLPPAIKLR